MQAQDRNNYERYIPHYHSFTRPLFYVLMIGGIVALVEPQAWSWLLPVWMILAGLAGALSTFFAREFAERAQNRAIRAEENLRYFQLTGQRMDPRVQMDQLVALRFASDAEFVALADRAVAEQLEPNAILAEIQDWRADHDQV